MYAGYQTNYYYEGIDGYLRQSGTLMVPCCLHAVFIGILAGGSSSQWIYFGTYQGYLPNSQSPGGVDTFWEKGDQCLLYGQGSLGAPDPPSRAYYLQYDRGGFHAGPCGGYYSYELRIGSANNPPVKYLNTGASSGRVQANTELQGGIAVATDRYGCAPDLSCTNPSYGLHLYTGGSWPAWTSSVSTAILTPPGGGPPFRHSYNTYWAFKTCPTAC